MNNFFLGIGLNSFQDKKIAKLEYAKSDCYRIKRALDLFWGSTDSRLCLHQQATKENIIDALNQLSSNIEYLFIFISSHGKKINQIPYIFCYNTNLDDLPDSALAVSEVTQILSNTTIKNIFLIIDCCEMQLSRVMLNNQIYIITPKKNVSYEDTFYKQSFFTKTIIKYIEKYHSQFPNNLNFNRYDNMRKLVFSKSLKTSFTYIYGDSGIGKSHFLRQVEENETDTYYVSIPNLHNLTYNIVLALISEKIMSRNVDKVINAEDTNPERFIRFFTNNNPHCQLLIDHIDHLNDFEANSFIQFLNEIPATKLIASSHITHKKDYIEVTH